MRMLHTRRGASVATGSVGAQGNCRRRQSIARSLGVSSYSSWGDLRWSGSSGACPRQTFVRLMVQPGCMCAGLRRWCRAGLQDGAAGRGRPAACWSGRLQGPTLGTLPVIFCAYSVHARYLSKSQDCIKAAYRHIHSTNNRLAFADMQVCDGADRLGVQCRAD